MVGVFPSNDQGKDGGAMISRRDLALLALIPTIYLAACCAVNALDAGPSIAHTLDKHPGGPVLARELLEAELINPTPLSDELYIILLDACEESGVEVPLALGVIEVESGFDVDAIGPDGKDIGLYQIRTSNHAWLTSETGADPMTPAGNIECGVWMLGYLLGRYETQDAALTAYRWGHDNGKRTYAAAVFEAAEKWRSALWPEILG